MSDQRKIELFFGLVRSVYGAGKFSSQWPTDLDIQAAKTMWADQINEHSPDELRDALKNAQGQAANGLEDWQWPNIGLILSGAKRFGTAAHKQFLPEPPRNIPPAHERQARMQNLRMEIGL